MSKKLMPAPGGRDSGRRRTWSPRRWGWFDRVAHYGRIKHGLAEVLHAATSDGLAGETYGPVIGAITLLLCACEEAGRVRPGLDPDDVLFLMGSLWRIDSPDWETRAARLLDLVVDGLRAGAPGGAPGPAPAGGRS